MEDPVVPDGEGDAKPLSIRFPEGLKRRIDEVAKKTGNDRSTTILHMVRYALKEWDRREAEDANER